MFFSLSFSRFSTMKFFLSFCWGEPENLLLDELNFFLPVSCVPSGTASRAAFVSWSLFFYSSSVHSLSSCFQVRILILISCFCWISWEINDTGPQSLKWPFWKIKMVLLVQSVSVSEDQHSALCHHNKQKYFHSWAKQRNFSALWAPQEISRLVEGSRGLSGEQEMAQGWNSKDWNRKAVLILPFPFSFHTKILPRSVKTVNH